MYNIRVKRLFLILGIFIFIYIAAVAAINFPRNEQPLLQDSTAENAPHASPSGRVTTKITQEGSGQEAKNGDSVTVHYTGTLENGTKFESSLDRNEPLTFTLGKGDVIQGWDEGVLGMKIGEKRRLTIPSDLAYGQSGQGAIPPNATLIFDIELLSINSSSQNQSPQIDLAQ